MARIRLSKSEKRRLVREWDRSGLTAEAFGEPRGIRGATLRSWGRALRGPLSAQPRSRKRPVAREVELVEVEHVVGAHAGAIEIVLTNQRRLLLTAGLTPAEIAELARALEAE